MRLRNCRSGAPLLVVLAIGCSSKSPPAAAPDAARAVATAPARSEKNVRKPKVIGPTLGPIGVVD
jgi:hypothetical protein